ncbi:MAG: hypothetical protein L6Q75_03685 [Burkholderiaceae bacterium]|nr:hypothetical protein [Burkholderiaceae bacterium]
MALPFTLVALVVILLAGIGLLRAMDSALLQAGNLAFRRDLANQAERGFARASSLLGSGALATEAAREADSKANNYVASRLAWPATPRASRRCWSTTAPSPPRPSPGWTSPTAAPA